MFYLNFLFNPPPVNYVNPSIGIQASPITDNSLLTEEAGRAGGAEGGSTLPSTWQGARQEGGNHAGGKVVIGFRLISCILCLGILPKINQVHGFFIIR